MTQKSGKLYGFYRAKVTEVDIPEFEEYGAVRVFIPDVMTGLDPEYNEETMGYIAYPANNPVGGRNDKGKESYGWGSVYVPRKEDWVWIFFEAGDRKKPYYFGALNIKNTKIPPEQRKNFTSGRPNEPHTIYTVLRTHRGRSIVLADSEDIQRIEITGKKRMSSPASSPAAEDQDSNYHIIDDNQTTIVLDERDGKEKLLIRTRKGDFLHVDIDERMLQGYFKKDIRLQTEQDLHLQVKRDIHVLVERDVYYRVKGEQDTRVEKFFREFVGKDKHEKVKGNIFRNSDQTIHDKSGQTHNSESGSSTNIKSGGPISINGSVTREQMGAGGATGAKNAKLADPIDPEGIRET